MIAALAYLLGRRRRSRELRARISAYTARPPVGCNVPGTPRNV